MSVSTLFILYADTPRRRSAVAAQSPSLDDYLLYGLSELRDRGYHVRHNLERIAYSPVVSKMNKAVNLIWHTMGGYGGDWATVVRCLPAINRSRLVFSTVDRVGIPLVLLKYLGVVSPPILYVSIGLPERLAQLKNTFMQRVYYHAFKQVKRIVCYAFKEAEELGAWFGTDNVKFVPFAVDTDRIRPMPRTSTTDVLSVGADPHRDFPLLMQFARRHPETLIRIITNTAHAQELGVTPANVQVLTDIPLVEVLERIASAQIIVLPVKPNSYSGATTVLLQAMAMAKPVVVSAVGAITRGYRLEDNTNCKLIKPGDVDNLEQAISALLLNSDWRQAIGAAARRTVVEHHSWSRYVETLVHLFEEVVQSTHANTSN